MSIEVRVPPLPESVAEATVLSWHKRAGDPVSRDENLVDLETDKVVLEVPAPADGVLGAIQADDGATVKAQDVLGLVEDGQAGRPAAAGRTKGEPKSGAAGRTRREAPAQEKKPPSSGRDKAADAEPVLTPAVRRLVKEFGLDARKIHGTGKGGRILKADVMTYLDSVESEGTVDEDLEAFSRVEPDLATSGVEGARPEQRVPMTRLRARIAERLVEAQRTAAILTTFNEVNVQAVNDLRRRYRDAFEKEHEVRLGFMSFFVKASVEALKRFPAVNASVDGSDIVYHGFYDIGIAVASPRGLVVPILRDCDQLSFADVEKGIAEYGRRAREGELTYEDLTGGTFTISNGGVFGSLLSTPILNPPQSAILGMHKIEERPVVENGEIVVRPMMYLALSYDHRIVDGREAVQFLVTIKECLEDPARLLLQV
ncbi:MAG: 2-oxoglutarate dehydrogenase complex dihydrolipoyllysine-residue succinyltransferase [Chromatiales bacterium]|jgi:2-oxoglutarate dehydrogenase E2 component (dihydrolipoamide succinyltransferase)